MLRKFDRKKNHGLYVSLKLFQPFVKFPHRIQKASHAVRTLRSIDGAHNFDSNDSLFFFVFFFEYVQLYFCFISWGNYAQE